MIAAVNQVYQVTFKGLLHNQTTLTSFYFRLLDVPPGGPDHVDAYDDLEAEVATAGDIQSLFRACCPSNWTLDETWVQLLLPTRVRKKVYPKGLAGTGPNASTVTNVSGSITRAAENSGRQFVGGIRIPMSPADMTNGLVGGPAYSALSALATKMKLGYGAPAAYLWTPGFISKYADQQGQLTMETSTHTLKIPALSARSS